MKAMTFAALCLVLIAALFINYLLTVEGFFDAGSSGQQRFSDTIQSILTPNPAGVSASRASSSTPVTIPNPNAPKPTPSPINPSNPTSQASDSATLAQYEQLQKLLKADIQNAVRAEILNQRALIPPIKCKDPNDDKKCEDSKESSPSLIQGSWFRGWGKDSSNSGPNTPYAQGQQQCQGQQCDDTPIPPANPIDMSQYIRKDSIPCYACKL